MPRFHTKHSTNSGFTLVEILIVVIILGILAAIAIPQFSNAGVESRKNSTMGQLKTLRAQIQLFRVQHNDVLPDLVSQQWDQMLSTTNVSGVVDVTVGGAMGPYVPKVPLNPLNSNSAIGASAAAGIGWVYDVNSGTLQATNQNATMLFDDATGVVQ